MTAYAVKKRKNAEIWGRHTERKRLIEDEKEEGWMNS
jgi:hypothetical protein